MDKIARLLKRKIDRARVRMERLQLEAYQYELETGADIEGLLNDVVEALISASEEIERNSRK